MGQRVIIGIVTVVVVIVGVVAYTSRSSPQEAMEKESGTMMEDDGSMMKDENTAMDTDSGMMEDGTVMDGDTMMTAGSYERYDAEKVARAASGDVVLFFRATWCPTCKTLDADIRAHLDDIPSRLTILDVDYDSSSQLKQKYGITYQHTFVQVDAQGNAIKKWSGSSTLTALVSEIQ